MSRYLHPEFRDEQSPTRYPFSDVATLTTESGFAIHPATFVDASVYPQGGGPGTGLRLIAIRDRVVTIWIGDDAKPQRCFGTIDRLEPADTVSLVDAVGRPSGILVMDTAYVAAFQTWPLGDHVLSPQAATFVATCTIPVPELGVKGFVVGGRVVSGDVWLIGEDGVIIRAVDAHTIRIDVVGDPLFKRKVCGPLAAFKAPRFIRTINGIPPDQFGNFNFTVGGNDRADTILRLRTSPPDTLVLEVVGKGVGG